MNTLGSLERVFFKCPEASGRDYKTFPEAEPETYHFMEQVFSVDTSAVYVFPYVRKRHSRYYIEVYVWDMMLYPFTYTRFIIADGVRMPEDEELQFLHYVEEHLYMHMYLWKAFIDDVYAHFPQWQLPRYNPYDICRMLEQSYYSSHPGPREILYKAGLGIISYNLGRIPEYNIIGTTPEMIIGHDMPLKLLRILNQRDFIEKLYEEDEMELCRQVYERFSGFINTTRISRGQWLYLEELSAPEGLFKGEKFNRHLYKNLCGQGSEYTLPAYKEFFRIRSELPCLRKRKIPKPQVVSEVVRQMEKIRKYNNGIADVDHLFKYRKDHEGYEYSSSDFTVIMPGRAFDIAIEALNQENCVMDYVSEHAQGMTTITFIRKTKSPDKSFVTMEIRGGTIKQVYGRFNKLPALNVYRFLEEYAEKKGFMYDPYDLIMGESDIDADLLKYAEAKKKVSALASQPEEKESETYVQLTLSDLFPDVFQ